MLQKLSIQNYAIIDEMEIHFSAHLNAITGETGAGKSIIAGALGLILGDRADNSVLLNREKKCIVEGHFNAADPAVMQFMKDHDLDHEDELIIRREIGANGKSRAFVNDTPVGLAQLQQLSSLLVDLHQQFDTLALGQSGFQRQVLDALAGQLDKISFYQQTYHQWHQVVKEIEKLKDQKLQFDKEAGYNQFQFSELEEADFKENELEELETEIKMMNHAEGIKAALTKAYADLEESDTPMVQQLKSLYNQLHSVAEFHVDLPALLQRLQSAQIELQDIAGEVDRIGTHIHFDAEKIEQLNERLSQGYKLQKKHGVQTTNELLKIKDQLEEKLLAVFQVDELIDKKEKEAARLFQETTLLATQLSTQRHAQAKPLQDAVNKLLAQVGMPNARLKVDIQQSPLNAFGNDAIEFLFDANKSNQFLPVRKVASGGELSRLMLCIKSLVAKSIDLPTLIFDEIDTGISGEAARQVGIIMKQLASKRQLVCITHQPQIAGKADAHFFVFKEIKEDRVKTNIRRLTQDERITTIAQMLSGEKPTAAALQNAREMVMN
jgi:DNA repair protein RecN (Recombination protein N)